MSEIKWEDPPPTRNKKWAPLLRALHDRPGHWAVIKENHPRPTSDLNNIGTRAGLVNAGLNPDDYEVTVRKQDDVTYKVYARYIGGES